MKQQAEGNVSILPTQRALSDLSEADIVILAQQGDKEAFHLLYTAHMGRVYALCLRLCADKALAEDATQEVFIQLWQKLNNFHGQSKFSTWLHSVTSNVTISYIRKQRGWWQKMFNIEEVNLGEEKADASAGHVDLDHYICKLPNRARHVFVLHAIEGYRHEEVATALGMAVGTSKAQFHRARQLLEEWMTDA